MIDGIGASGGICIGKVFKYNQIELIIQKQEHCNVDDQKNIFSDNVERSISELKNLMKKTEQNVGEKTAAIFGAHIEILNDPELFGAVNNMIEKEKVNADYALKSVSDSFVAIFESMDDEYIRERAADIKDVSKRVLMHIQGIKSKGLSEINEEIILVAEDLTPSDTAQLNKKLVKGFITNVGGRTSHSAIMARTFEIPAVVGTNNGFEVLSDGDLIILDGYQGKVIKNPSEIEINDYQSKIEILKKEKELWYAFKNKKSITKDGNRIELGANIGNLGDVEGAIDKGAESIGLYRTEFLYMGRKDFPSEEEQFIAYKEVLEKMEDKVVVVRTLDIGGDKELEYFEMEDELNPFLGNRAIRLCMIKPDIFRVQLRALLRASVYGNLHIMFPMIATIDEFRRVKKFLKDVEKELLEEGQSVSETYKLGIMVEIPAAALLADIFAKEVDFFSIGTNDLIQYTFAADRMNEHVSYLYQPFNPSLLRLISMVVNSAHREGKWVGMCGEMAGEGDALPLLLGLGLDELSMSSPSILKTRYMASKIEKTQAVTLVEKALMQSNEVDVKRLVLDFLGELQ